MHFLPAQKAARRAARFAAVAALVVTVLAHAAERRDGSIPFTPPADYSERVLASVNAYRLSKGLPALVTSPVLVGLAAGHSARMSDLRKPSHDGFKQRFERSGGYLCVENVARGFKVPEEVTRAWRASVEHHRNLLEPRVTLVGIANHATFVTMFACDEVS